MVAPSLRMPVVGRSIAGVVVLCFAGPMCRLVGLSDDSHTARRIGAAVAVTDVTGALGVVAAGSAVGQRRAALTNAALDVLLASALVALGTRRHGSQRVSALLASASVWFGAGAWFLGARQLQD